MQRREFITLLGGAAVAWPRATRAQQRAMPVIGFLNNGSSNAYLRLVAAFRQGLAEAGYEEGRNIAVEYRWAEGENDRLPALVQDLVQRHVAVIAATGGTASALATKAAATSVPIVFVLGADPIKFNLVASINRPGGNITGVSFLANLLLAKQVEILHETISKNTAIGFLVNPTNPNSEADTNEVLAAAATLDRKIFVVKASTEAEITAAFSSLAQQQVGALLIFPDALYTSQRDQLVTLAVHQKLPTLYNSREFAAAGGLMGYGSRQTDAYRQAGLYTGRILNGENPAELPVIQSATIELVVNLKTAKSLGLTVPPSVLARADEVIE
jgi:putative ABC transport system substrate-binding protein